jgi:hypothetical protein
LSVEWSACVDDDTRIAFVGLGVVLEHLGNRV